MSAWLERAGLVESGWLEPTPDIANDGRLLVGLTVFVQGYGVGRVLDFSKALVGSSSHTIDFGEGGERKVTLERKGKGTPYLLEPVGAAGPAELGPTEVDDAFGVDGDASEQELSATHAGSLEDDDELGEEGRALDDRDELDDDDTDDEGRFGAPIERTRSEEWEGIDDPGYVRIPVMAGLMPFGHEEEREETLREGEEKSNVPEGWETAVSRSTGKVYFINTITGDSQYEFPAGPARMYASESDLDGSDLEGDAELERELKDVQAEMAAGAAAAAAVEVAAPGGGGSGSTAGAPSSSADAAAAAAGEVPPDSELPSAEASEAAIAEAQRAAAAEAEAAAAEAEAAAAAAAASAPAPAPAPTPVPATYTSTMEAPKPPPKKPSPWACMPIKFYYEPEKTGFEASTEFNAVPDELIIGRYKIVKFLGEGAFSKAIQCVDTEVKSTVCIKIVKCGDRKDYFDQSLDEIKLLQYINSGGAAKADMDHVHIFHMCLLLQILLSLHVSVVRVPGRAEICDGVFD
jgi:hypothetical protein